LVRELIDPLAPHEDAMAVTVKDEMNPVPGRISQDFLSSSFADFEGVRERPGG